MKVVKVRKIAWMVGFVLETDDAHEAVEWAHVRDIVGLSSNHGVLDVKVRRPQGHMAIFEVPEALTSAGDDGNTYPVVKHLCEGISAWSQNPRADP